MFCHRSCFLDLWPFSLLSPILSGPSVSALRPTNNKQREKITTYILQAILLFMCPIIISLCFVSVVVFGWLVFGFVFLLQHFDWCSGHDLLQPLHPFIQNYCLTRCLWNKFMQTINHLALACVEFHPTVSSNSQNYFEFPFSSAAYWLPLLA